MKKSKDTAIKNLLNLKEDYMLNLDDYKDSDNLNLKEAGAEPDDEEDTEASDEEVDEEDDVAEDEDEDSTEDDSAEKSDETEKSTETKTTSKPASKANPFVEVKGLPEIFSRMKKAQSPADVGLCLKDFLGKLRAASLEALVATKSEKE
jgi:cobalamin biosynthesis protein CobT